MKKQIAFQDNEKQSEHSDATSGLSTLISEMKRGNLKGKEAGHPRGRASLPPALWDNQRAPEGKLQPICSSFSLNEMRPRWITFKFAST